MDREPERPRSEPEILPPERNARGAPFGAQGPDPFAAWGQQRIFVRRIGPLGMVLWGAAALLVLAAIIFLVASFVMIAIPVALAAALIGGAVTFFRRSLRL